MVLVRYGVLALIALAPFVYVGAVKPAPLVIAALVFATHGLSCLATRRFDRAPYRDGLSAVLLFMSFEISGAVLLSRLALVIRPPIPAEHGPPQSLEQLLVGALAGLAVGAVVTFIALRPAWRHRRAEQALLHVVGLAVLASAIWSSAHH